MALCVGHTVRGTQVLRSLQGPMAPCEGSQAGAGEGGAGHSGWAVRGLREASGFCLSCMVSGHRTSSCPALQTPGTCLAPHSPRPPEGLQGPEGTNLPPGLAGPILPFPTLRSCALGSLDAPNRYLQSPLLCRLK